MDHCVQPWNPRARARARETMTKGGWTVLWWVEQQCDGGGRRKIAGGSFCGLEREMIAGVSVYMVEFWGRLLYINNSYLHENILKITSFLALYDSTSDLFLTTKMSKLRCFYESLLSRVILLVLDWNMTVYFSYCPHNAVFGYATKTNTFGSFNDEWSIKSHHIMHVSERNVAFHTLAVKSQLDRAIDGRQFILFFSNMFPFSLIPHNVVGMKLARLIYPCVQATNHIVFTSYPNAVKLEWGKKLVTGDHLDATWLSETKPVV